MAAEEAQKRAYDAFAWFMNVSTSVLIVFVNKVLMSPSKGYGFTFGEQQPGDWAAPRPLQATGRLPTLAGSCPR